MRKTKITTAYSAHDDSDSKVHETLTKGKQVQSELMRFKFLVDGIDHRGEASGCVKACLNEIANCLHLVEKL